MNFIFIFLFYFYFFILFFLFFFNLLLIFLFNKNFNVRIINVLYFIITLNKETRIQLDFFLLLLLLFFLYFIFLIASFNDNNEEFIEFFDSFFFIFFIIIISFLFVKYSIHYFSFLESSIKENKNANFITKQLFRDFINTFALFLRFFILLFRINIYDILDDFYDSYYIYLADFDDDEYYNETFFDSFFFFNFDFDNKDDKSFSFENESVLFNDVFYFYYLIIMKFYLFIFFILEEILRLSLAFYICYLIIFEVHSVNYSFNETSLFYKKPSLFFFNGNNKS